MKHSMILVAIETPVLVALLTALVSIVVSCLSAYFTYRTKIKESELGELNAERKARRDYEYEARKRLYSQIEPLLFELRQLSVGGLKRVGSLARTAREGHLANDSTSWLSSEGYYALSTVYKLFAPLAVVKIMQRRLTLIDLKLEPQIEKQYTLANNLYHTFAADFKLARTAPARKYDPNIDNGLTPAELAAKLSEDPQTHYRQGLQIGRLDNAVDALIVPAGEAALRCLSFGEFETKYADETSDLHKQFAFVVKLFLNFHPQTRPILWRILITQVYLYSAILADNDVVEANGGSIRIPSKERLKRYDWRHDEKEATNEEIEQPFEVAEQYLSKRHGKTFSTE